MKASYGSFHWTPPKGHVDEGEDDFTTALRETQEEAGYDIVHPHIPTLLLDKTTYNHLTIRYTASDLNIHKEHSKTLHYKVRGENKTVVYWLAELRNAQNQPTLSDEHTAFEWLPAAEACQLSGFNDFRQMVDHFAKIIPTIGA